MKLISNLWHLQQELRRPRQRYHLGWWPNAPKDISARIRGNINCGWHTSKPDTHKMERQKDMWSLSKKSRWNWYFTILADLHSKPRTQSRTQMLPFGSADPYWSGWCWFLLVCLSMTGHKLQLQGSGYLVWWFLGWRSVGRVIKRHMGLAPFICKILAVLVRLVSRESLGLGKSRSGLRAGFGGLNSDWGRMPNKADVP
jgi:hypothetical protein